MAAKMTSYIDAEGVRRTGYIIDGSTYEDAEGIIPVAKGSIVEAGGKHYVKGVGENGASMLYSDYIKSLGAEKPSETGKNDFLDEMETMAKADYNTAKSYNESVYGAGLQRSAEDTARRRDELNVEYGELGTQLYRDYMLQRKNLPQLLAAQGITGGLSESSLVGIEAGYQRELSENERRRLSAIGDLEAEAAENQRKLLLEKSEADARADEAYSERITEILEKKEKKAEEAAEEAAASEKLLYSRALDKAEILAAAGDFSGYRALGYSEAEIAAMKKAYDENQFAIRLKIAQQKAKYGDTSELMALLGI